MGGNYSCYDTPYGNYQAYSIYQTKDLQDNLILDSVKCVTTGTNSTTCKSYETKDQCVADNSKCKPNDKFCGPSNTYTCTVDEVKNPQSDCYNAYYKSRGLPLPSTPTPPGPSPPGPSPPGPTPQPTPEPTPEPTPGPTPEPAPFQPPTTNRVGIYIGVGAGIIVFIFIIVLILFLLKKKRPVVKSAFRRR